MSGIIQFQTGFPIRIQTQDDTELISSLFFVRFDSNHLGIRKLGQKCDRG